MISNTVKTVKTRTLLFIYVLVIMPVKGADYLSSSLRWDIVGEWQVYKERVSGIMWDDEGMPYTGSFTHDVDMRMHYMFTPDYEYEIYLNEASEVVHYSDNRPYTIEPQAADTWLITISGAFDMPKPSDPAISGRSPITIYKLTENEIEWEYTYYGGDEGPVTYYQYLINCSSNPHNSHQAVSWYGVHYYHGYPQESQVPLITDIKFSIDGDTIINGSPYKKILYTHLFDDIFDAYRGAIRYSTDKQQVYFVPWGSQVEYLLYDFSVNQGDVVRAYNGFYDISCEEMAQEDPESSITPAWTVLDIKTMDGRKHISVQNKANGNITEWIEGIGTQHIFWPVGRSCLPTGMEYQTVRTLCVEDGDGNILYSFNTDDLGIRNDCPEWKLLPIAHIHAKTPSATKLFHNAQILILRGERTYTITGQEVK